MPYSAEQIDTINKATTNFYLEVADSFSETRQSKWPGWISLLSFIEKSIYNNNLNFADIACGNLRFEVFLEENFPDININAELYDNCESLLRTNVLKKTLFNFYSTDIIECIKNNKTIVKNKHDLIVSFGLLHHIPSFELRKKFFANISSSLNINGYFIVSFWQFMDDVRLNKKAIKTTKIAKEKLGIEILEENDYFLNWKDNVNVFRFCHNFTDAEIIKYVEFSGLKLIDSFKLDAGNDKLNKYIVLKKI